MPDLSRWKTQLLSIIVFITMFVARDKFLFANVFEPDAPPTRDDLDEISDRGRTLADYDYAAARGSDAIEKIEVKPGTVERYIAREDDGRWVVAFGKLSPKKDAFLTAFEAFEEDDENADFTVKAYDPPRADKDFLLASALAIDLAFKNFVGPERPYNFAVVPADDDQLFIYVLPAQIKEGSWPLGGDTRFLVSADGKKILEKRKLHDQIVDFPPDQSGAAGKIQESSHVHELSDVPEDTDVFHVLVREPSIPEKITTKNYIYMIDAEGDVTFAPRGSKASAAPPAPK